MKSHVIKNPQQILSFGLDENQQGRLDAVAKGLKLQHKVIDVRDTNQTIGYLCGFKGFEPAAESGQALEGKQCLIFSGIEKNSMSRLLSELKSAGLSVPLKAMVTPTNRDWVLSDLIAELEREHEMMTKGK